MLELLLGDVLWLSAFEAALVGLAVLGALVSRGGKPLPGAQPTEDSLRTYLVVYAVGLFTSVQVVALSAAAHGIRVFLVLANVAIITYLCLINPWSRQQILRIREMLLTGVAGGPPPEDG